MSSSIRGCYHCDDTDGKPVKERHRSPDPEKEQICLQMIIKIRYFAVTRGI